MISLISHRSSEGEQWGRYYLARWDIFGIIWELGVYNQRTWGIFEGGSLDGTPQAPKMDH